MRVQRFSSPEDTAGVYENHFLELSHSEWKKQTHITVVRQNILSIVMLKNVKLSNGNVRFHPANQKYARPEIYVVTYVFT